MLTVTTKPLASYIKYSLFSVSSLSQVIFLSNPPEDVMLLLAAILTINTLYASPAEHDVDKKAVRFAGTS